MAAHIHSGIAGLAGIAGILLQAQVAFADGTSFYEEFETLASERWFISDGWSNSEGHGCMWSKDDVAVKDGVLRLSISEDGPNGYTCGELQSRSFFSYGTYEIRMRSVGEHGTVSGFFTYTGPVHDNPWDEIDIEFLGRAREHMQTNYFVAGKGNNEKLVSLGFDSSAEMRNYAFVWAPDAIRWYVDNELVHEVSNSTVPLPVTESKLYMSLWNGVGDDMRAWLGDFSPSSLPAEIQIERVAFTAAGDACQFPESLVCSMAGSLD